MTRFDKLILRPSELESKRLQLEQALYGVLDRNTSNLVGICMGLRERRFDGLDPNGMLDHEWSLNIVVRNDAYEQRLKKGRILLPEETYRRQAPDYDAVMRRKNTLVFLSIGNYLDIPYGEQFIEVFQDDILNHGFCFSKPAVIIRSTLKLPRRRYEDDFFRRFSELPRQFGGEGEAPDNDAPDTEAEEDDGATALQQAFGNPEQVSLLLAAGADVNARLSERAEPVLCSAVRRNADIEVVRLLLSAGAALDAQDGNGETALIAAVRMGREEIVELLLDAGANPEIQCYGHGGTALLCLARQDFNGSPRSKEHGERLRLAGRLIKAGADIEAKEASGATSLNILAEFGTSEFLSLLIQAGANVENEMVRGSRPLADAAWMGRVANVRLLIEAGAEMIFRRGSGSGILHLVAERFAYETGKAALAYQEIARRLIEAGAELNCQDGQGCTPLMRALETYGEFKRNKWMVGFAAMLIGAGTDISLRNKRGETALDIAEAAGRTELVALLSGTEQAARAQTDCGRQKAEPVRTGINTQDRDGRTALHRAVGHEDAEAMRRLLAAGAALDLQDEQGNTPLMEAVRYAKLALVRPLMNAGAELNKKNKNGCNCLDIAATAVATALTPEKLREAVLIVKLLQESGVEFEQCKERREISCVSVPAIFRAHEELQGSEGKAAADAAAELVRLVDGAGLQVTPILRPPRNKGCFDFHTVQYRQKGL